MDKYTLAWAEILIEKHVKKPVKVLDVGSLNVNGTFRGLFSNADGYVGVDVREGRDVDMVLDGHDLTDAFPLECFDVVICMNMLEHDKYFWKTLEQINMVIKRGGLFFVGAPTVSFLVHDHPDDYYRFTKSTFRQIILKGYDILDIREVLTKPKERNKNPIINALGRKI